MCGTFLICKFKVQSVRIVAACISGHIPSENVLLFEHKLLGAHSYSTSHYSLSTLILVMLSESSLRLVAVCTPVQYVESVFPDILVSRCEGS